MCNDVPWKKWLTCFSPAAQLTGNTTSGDFTSEIEKNPALKCAIEEARKLEPRILKLLKKWKKYLDRDDVELIMAYTDDECNDGVRVYKFYEDLNQDSDQYGLDGGKYPVTKNKLRDALLSMGKKTKIPSQLHRKENIKFLYKYKDVSKKEILRLEIFTSTSDEKCLYKCKNFFNIIYQNPSYGANIAEFSRFYEREWLLPPFIGGLTVKSIDEGKDPVEVTVEGPKLDHELCSSAYMFSLGSTDYMLVCFFSSLVVALFTHPGIISIG